MKSYIKFIDAVELGDLKKAKKYFNKAKKFMSKSEVRNYKSLLFYIEGKFEDALKYTINPALKANILIKLDKLKEAKKLLKKVKEKAKINLIKASILRQENKYYEAIKVLKKINTNSLIIDKEWLLGSCYRKFNLKLALYHFKKAYKLSKKFSMLDEAFALCGLAGTLRELGKIKKSYDLYKRAYSIFKRLGNLYGIAYSLCGIGNALALLNKKSLAIRKYKQSIFYYKFTGDRNSINDIRNRIKYLNVA
ncbi:MAG: tetratricopeptide repeat protein [bacterium]|nr:tetratricopeptide repeat protein [bacterium]